MRDELTFVIGSADEPASFGLLSRAIEDIRRLLRDIDYAIYGPKDRQDWRIIRLKSSAPTITIAPGRPDTESVGVIAEGLQMITEGTDQTPHRFTEPVFEDLKRMKRLFQGKGKAHSIAVKMDDTEVATIQQDIAVKVDRVLSAGHHNLGSLQGKLEAINVHKSPTATIWERISESPVRWVFPRSDIDRVKTLLEKSVIVTGDIFYFSNGAPRSIAGVVDIQEITPAQHSERAGFGSIPDKGVQEMGAAEWLQVVRGEGH